MPSPEDISQRGLEYLQLARILLDVLQKQKCGRELVIAWCDEIFTYVLNPQNLRNEIKSTDDAYRHTVSQLDSASPEEKLSLLQREKELDDQKQVLLKLAEIRVGITNESLLDLIS